MNEELERLIEDRNQAEDDLEHLEEELNAFERLHPEDHQDFEEWNDLHNEVNEATNHVAYLNCWIESYEGGYEN